MQKYAYMDKKKYYPKLVKNKEQCSTAKIVHIGDHELILL